MNSPQTKVSVVTQNFKNSSDSKVYRVTIPAGYAIKLRGTLEVGDKIWQSWTNDFIKVKRGENRMGSLYMNEIGNDIGNYFLVVTPLNNPNPNKNLIK